MLLYGYYYDFGQFATSIVLLLVAVVISLVASIYAKTSLKRYSKVQNSYGITGQEAARRILNDEGLYDVQIECLADNSEDYFDARTNKVHLSADYYNEMTIAALGVAVHECGHAIQHAEDYMPIKMRTSLAPVVELGNNLSMPIIMLGVLLSWNQTLINIGIWAFSLALVFQLITLPVEFNASRRAIAKLESHGFLTTEELVGCKRVLRATAMTYVAAAAVTALQVLRLVLLYGGRRRRD